VTDFTTGAAQTDPATWFATQAFNSATIGTPGAAYQYRNANYHLLGMIVAAIKTPDTYETYCRNTVLVPRGAPNARLSANTGVAALGAGGGWEISANEYSSFYRQAFDRRRLSQAARTFLDRALDTSCAACSYGLGVLVRPAAYPNVPIAVLALHTRGGVFMPLVMDAATLEILPRYDLFHDGDWDSTATNPQQFSSIAAYWPNGVSAFVLTDRKLGAALSTLGTLLRPGALNIALPTPTPAP
jgi:CubicO group peptidase (beta-lactamase class C family)